MLFCYASRPFRIIPAYAGSTQYRSLPRGRCRDHPRIRGEHLQCFLHFPEPGGSSPHTRGAHRSMDGQARERRIIPAYAGSTHCAASSTRDPKDHPRIRGEHPSSEFETYHDGGSSPHTRGAPVTLGIPTTPVGIIPAYAGSTFRIRLMARCRMDHPRIRGEHQIYTEERGGARGIIPAYAGSTRSAVSCR